MIAAGALLKDTQTGRVLAQLKLKSLSGKPIKAVSVAIMPFDTIGNQLGEAVAYQYLDLQVVRSTEFGSKSPIFLPDQTTRQFSAVVTTVVFTDNTIWNTDGAAWEELPEPNKLRQSLDNHELHQQFLIHYGAQCRVMPMQHKDLWYCTCGAINRQEDESCYQCRLSCSELMHLDLAQLREECDARLAAEEQQRLEAERQRRQEERAARIRARKIRKTTIILTVIVVLLTAAALLATNVVIPNIQYNQAVTLLETGRYDEAAAAFEAMEDYKDSAAMVTETKYQKSMALMNAGQYYEAIAAFEALDGYKDSAKQIKACETVILDEKYNDAVALMDAGNVIDAYEALIALDGYKDSAEKADSILYKYIDEKIKPAEIGDYVIFGTYEQDNDTSNGKENIEWLVLDKQDGKTLVISKYALDCNPYNTEWTDVTWETCSLRKWLNNEFIDTAFSTEEQARIPTVTVSADKNPIYYGTDPGNATEDQVFLLSIVEAKQYFRSDDARQCKATDYAVANGAYVDSENGNCRWWLRSPGSYQTAAVYVDRDGYVGSYGTCVDNGRIAVRPAMWIDLA